MPEGRRRPPERKWVPVVLAGTAIVVVLGVLWFLLNIGSVV